MLSDADNRALLERRILAQQEKALALAKKFIADGEGFVTVVLSWDTMTRENRNQLVGELEYDYENGTNYFDDREPVKFEPLSEGVSDHGNDSGDEKN